MKIRLSQHAQNKIAERKLEVHIIKKILASPDFIYYDLISKSMVAIGKAKLDEIETNIIIPFVKERDTFKIITIYPCKELDREIKKKEGIRWVRIK